MIYVGIDATKNKFDYFITNLDGKVLFKSFIILNPQKEFETLFQRIESVPDDFKVKIGLEATKYYSYNLLGFFLIKVCRSILLIRYIAIFTEKISPLEKPKRIRLIPVLLPL